MEFECFIAAIVMKGAVAQEGCAQYHIGGVVCFFYGARFQYCVFCSVHVVFGICNEAYLKIGGLCYSAHGV